MQPNISDKYEFFGTVSVEDYLRLRHNVGWMEIAPEQAQNGINNSFQITSVKFGGETIGMARLLWDGGYCAYLSDVIVDVNHRHKGLASMMINSLIKSLQQSLKEGWQVKLMLAAAKGKESFYEQFGFVQRPNENTGAGMEKLLRG